MKIVSLNNGQLAFDEMKGSLEYLSNTNRWVKMSDALPWTGYEKIFNYIQTTSELSFPRRCNAGQPCAT